MASIRFSTCRLLVVVTLVTLSCGIWAYDPWILIFLGICVLFLVPPILFALAYKVFEKNNTKDLVGHILNACFLMGGIFILAGCLLVLSESPGIPTDKILVVSIGPGLFLCGIALAVRRTRESS